MIRIAFSTLACPDWPLDVVARRAAEWGYTGVELRSFGGGGTALACDPALTDPDKARALFDGAGVELCSIATGVRFDEPIFPPVVGQILLDRHASVYEGRRFVELARSLGAENTRVYGYGSAGRETKRSLLRRIADRLRLVCDAARHDAGRVVLENGGAFSSAEDMLELIDLVDHGALRCAYDLKAAIEAGDEPAEGVALLADRLTLARVRDIDHASCAPFVEAVTRETGGDAWIVYEYPKLWDETLAPAEQTLPGAAPRLAQWVASGTSGSRVA